MYQRKYTLKLLVGALQAQAEATLMATIADMGEHPPRAREAPGGFPRPGGCRHRRRRRQDEAQGVAPPLIALCDFMSSGIVKLNRYSTITHA